MKTLTTNETLLGKEAKGFYENITKNGDMFAEHILTKHSFNYDYCIKNVEILKTDKLAIASCESGEYLVVSNANTDIAKIIKRIR